MWNHPDWVRGTVPCVGNHFQHDHETLYANENTLRLGPWYIPVLPKSLFSSYIDWLSGKTSYPLGQRSVGRPHTKITRSVFTKECLAQQNGSFHRKLFLFAFNMSHCGLPLSWMCLWALVGGV